MLQKSALVLFAALLILSSCSSQEEKQQKVLETFSSGQWIDLTYDLSEETIFWPTSEHFKLDTVSEGMTEGGYYYSAYQFCTAEHGGTHIDAPVHFAQGKKSVDQLSLEQLIGPAVKIDVSANALANPDYLISIEDITAWEKEHGEIPENSIVLLQTGWGQHWPDPLKYLGTALRGPEGVAALHFPGLSPEAAEWLINNRKIKAVGIDTASIDRGQTSTYPSHVVLMKQNIPAFENVANMDELPYTGAQVIALPLRIKGGSGSPLRIIAFVPDTM